MNRRSDPRIEPTGQKRPIAEALHVEWSFSVEHLSFDIRPELGSEIAYQAEPEPDGPLDQSESYRIQPVRIPQIGKECRAVRAADAPRGQGLAARVGAREHRSPECMPGPAPESLAERAIITRILVKRGVQTK